MKKLVPGNKRYLFDRSIRIRREREILEVLKRGTKVEYPAFIIFFKQNELKSDRFAVLVSRKLGNAVVRNKIKRLSREAFRTNKRDDPPFYDILIKPRPGMNELKLAEIIEEYRSWQSKHIQ